MSGSDCGTDRSAEVVGFECVDGGVGGSTCRGDIGAQFDRRPIGVSQRGGCAVGGLDHCVLNHLASDLIQTGKSHRRSKVRRLQLRPKPLLVPNRVILIAHIA